MERKNVRTADLAELISGFVCSTYKNLNNKVRVDIACNSICVHVTILVIDADTNSDPKVKEDNMKKDISEILSSLLFPDSNGPEIINKLSSALDLNFMYSKCSEVKQTFELFFSHNYVLF